MVTLNNLKKYRKIKKLTQLETSKILRITLRHYQNIEAGTSNGSVKLLKQLAILYGTTIDDLLNQDINKGNNTMKNEKK